MKYQHFYFQLNNIFVKSVPCITCSLLLLVVGCATMSPLSISEGKLEGYFREQVVKFDQQQLAAGSPLSVGLDNVDITLGPEGRDVILLKIDGQVALSALLAKIPVDMSLLVEGAPFYESKEKAIYIKRLTLVDSRIESQVFSGDFKPLTETLMRVVAQMLDVMPIYTLDETHWAGKLMSLAEMDLKVAPGKLVFVPAD